MTSASTTSGPGSYFPNFSTWTPGTDKSSSFEQHYGYVGRFPGPYSRLDTHQNGVHTPSPYADYNYEPPTTTSSAMPMSGSSTTASADLGVKGYYPRFPWMKSYSGKLANVQNCLLLLRIVLRVSKDQFYRRSGAISKMN